MNRRTAIRQTAILMGGAISASAISAIMSGCQADPKVLVWKPVLFNPEQGLAISEIAERIMPTTDTPGAKEAGVPQFIDLVLRDCYQEKDRKAVMAGLDSIEKDSQESYKKSFINLSTEQMDKLLQKYDLAAYEARKDPAISERHFFSTLKELTLLGYFTSEIGATEVLQYESVPGAYVGCKPLAEVGKAWAS